MTGLEVLILAMMLQVKHVITDFFLQKKYQYSHKHIYGHPGGILHASIITAGTLATLSVFSLLVIHVNVGLMLIIAAAEFVAHYNIDWTKMNICRYMNWKPDNSENFWYLLGFDQFLHHMTNLLQILVIYLASRC